jgi:DNA-binding beta-propeller fold protein YncE
MSDTTVKIAANLARLGVLAACLAAVTAVWSEAVAPINSLQNPYTGTPFGKMPEGRIWGSTAGIGIDRDGKSVWVAERCGSFLPPNEIKPGTQFGCGGSDLDPIPKFDETGKLVKSFGAGLIQFPHGLSVDPEGNIWVTDGLAKDGKGHQIWKLSPDGKVLLVLGKPGVAGSGLDEFHAPSAVQVARNGGSGG